MTKAELQAELKKRGIGGWNAGTIKADLEALLVEPEPEPEHCHFDSVEPEPVKEPVTDEAVAAALNDDPRSPLSMRIMRVVSHPAGFVEYFVDGGIKYPGRLRWVKVPGMADAKERARLIEAKLSE